MGEERTKITKKHLYAVFNELKKIRIVCPVCGEKAWRVGMVSTKRGKKPRYKCSVCGISFYAPNASEMKDVNLRIDDLKMIREEEEKIVINSKYYMCPACLRGTIIKNVETGEGGHIKTDWTLCNACGADPEQFIVEENNAQK